MTTRSTPDADVNGFRLVCFMEAKNKAVLTAANHASLQNKYT
jgi:hypothetical protein